MCQFIKCRIKGSLLYMSNTSYVMHISIQLDPCAAYLHVFIYIAPAYSTVLYLSSQLSPLELAIEIPNYFIKIFGAHKNYVQILQLVGFEPRTRPQRFKTSVRVCSHSVFWPCIGRQIVLLTFFCPQKKMWQKTCPK